MIWPWVYLTSSAVVPALDGMAYKELMNASAVFATLWSGGTLSPKPARSTYTSFVCNKAFQAFRFPIWYSALVESHSVNAWNEGISRQRSSPSFSARSVQAGNEACQEQNASHFKRSSASIINLCPLIPLLHDFWCNSVIVELYP